MLPPVDLAPQPYGRILRLAERHPRRALVFARRLADTAPQDPWAIFTLGWAFFRTDQAATAIPLFEQSHALFGARDQRIAALHTRRAHLLASIMHSAAPITPSQWDELAAAYAAAGMPIDVGRLRVQQAGYHNIHGAPEAVHPLLQPYADTLIAQGTDDDRGRLHLVLGCAHSDLGHFEQALAHFAQAIDAFAACHSPLGVARCRLERSNVYLRQEVFEPALDDLYAARARFHHLGLTFRAAHCDKAIGLVESRIGRYDRALTATLRARSTFVDAHARLDVANADLNLGVVATYCGMFDLAHTAYTRARRVYADLGIRRMQLVCDRNIGGVLRSLGRVQEAHEIIQGLLNHHTKRGDVHEYAETLLLGALTHADLGGQQEALALLERAATAFLRLSNRAAAAECWLEQGWIALKAGQSEAAEALFRQAEEPLRSRPFHAWRVAYGLGKLAEQQGEPAAARLHYARASDAVARLRGSLASEHASSSLHAQAASLMRDAMMLAADAGDGYEVLRLSEQHRALALAKQLAQPAPTGGSTTAPFDTAQVAHDPNGSTTNNQDQIAAYVEHLLYARHLSERFETERDDFDSGVLRASLDAAYPQGWLVLSYVIIDTTILLVSFGPSSLTLTRIPYDAALRKAIDKATLPRYRLYTYLDLAWEQGQAGRQWEPLALLGERLLPAHVRAGLHPDLHLVLVAGDVLHALPWAALHVGETWLCEQATLLHLPALWLWRNLAARHPRSSAALLVGCHHFSGRADELPGVGQELAQVAALWNGPTRRLLDDEATREVFSARLSTDQGGYGLVHIASHAVSYPGKNMLAHIKLADGDLLLDELCRLHLEGAIVVLSVCEGGTHEVLPGDELLGLGRALLVAGASVVIASSWKVYDQAVLELLGLFYEELRAKESAPAALARAQRRVWAKRGATIAGSAAPLVWGSFYVLGVGLCT